MMKKITAIALWSVTFFVITMLLLPKISLWYELESLIQPKGLVIDGESLDDKGTCLEIKEGTLYFGNMQVAYFSDASLSLWIFSNSIHIEKLFFSKGLAMLQGLNVSKARISHSIFMPLRFSIQAEGSFGTIEGEIDLSDKKLTLQIQASKLLMQNTMIMRMLKKTPKGYSYARNF